MRASSSPPSSSSLPPLGQSARRRPARRAGPVRRHLPGKALVGVVGRRRHRELFVFGRRHRERTRRRRETAVSSLAYPPSLRQRSSPACRRKTFSRPPFPLISRRRRHRAVRAYIIMHQSFLPPTTCFYYYYYYCVYKHRVYLTLLLLLYNQKRGRTFTLPI